MQKLFNKTKKLVNPFLTTRSKSLVASGACLASSCSAIWYMFVFTTCKKHKIKVIWPSNHRRVKEWPQIELSRLSYSTGINNTTTTTPNPRFHVSKERKLFSNNPIKPNYIQLHSPELRKHIRNQLPWEWFAGSMRWLDRVHVHLRTRRESTLIAFENEKLR